MAKEDTEEEEAHNYCVAIEMHGIYGATMTDAGIPAGELAPVGDAMLSPGDPSPLGRTSEGDLAYPVFRDRETLTLARRDLAAIAAALAPGDLRDRIIRETLPAVLYPNTAHGRIAREGDLRALAEGRPDDISLLD